MSSDISKAIEKVAAEILASENPVTKQEIDNLFDDIKAYTVSCHDLPTLLYLSTLSVQLHAHIKSVAERVRDEATGKPL